MSTTGDAILWTARVVVWPVVVVIALALLVVVVLWLIGAPGRKREREIAAKWRADHPSLAPRDGHGRWSDRP